MPPRTAYLYSALAVAFAVAFGLGIGPYWVDDAVALAMMAFVVVLVCLRVGQHIVTPTSLPAPMSTSSQMPFKATNQASASEQGHREYVPRSKIAHFVLLSRIRFKSSTALDSYNAYERKLLSRPDWQGLSVDELRELAQQS
jgi:hypothetical protein